MNRQVALAALLALIALLGCAPMGAAPGQGLYAPHPPDHSDDVHGGGDGGGGDGSGM